MEFEWNEQNRFMRCMQMIWFYKKRKRQLLHRYIWDSFNKNRSNASNLQSLKNINYANQYRNNNNYHKYKTLYDTNVEFLFSKYYQKKQQFFCFSTWFRCSDVKLIGQHCHRFMWCVFYSNCLLLRLSRFRRFLKISIGYFWYFGFTNTCFVICFWSSIFRNRNTLS